MNGEGDYIVGGGRPTAHCDWLAAFSISVQLHIPFSIVTLFQQSTRSTCSTRLRLLVENRSDLISTVWKTPYLAMPPLTNTLPRHFRRGPASHKPFDFSPSFYTFYMFYTAKPFSGKQVRPNFHCLEDAIPRHAHMGEHPTAAFLSRTSQPSTFRLSSIILPVLHVLHG